MLSIPYDFNEFLDMLQRTPLRTSMGCLRSCKWYPLGLQWVSLDVAWGYPLVYVDVHICYPSLRTSMITFDFAEVTP